MIVALLASSGCAAAQRDVTPALQGSWGGPHIGLTVGTLDSGVDFDCAEGTIYGPYLVDKDGRFAWAGDFTPGTGGPAHIGEPEKPTVPATYVGVFRGPEMTLSVELEDHRVIGPFALERFAEPQLTRCL